MGEAPDREVVRLELDALGDLLDEIVGLAATAPIFNAAADAPTVAGQTSATLDDYTYARDLVRSLAARVDQLPAEDFDRLDLNADLRQLAFHLDEELTAQRANGLDPATFNRSLTFLKRHIVRLREEYEEQRHLDLDPDERTLLAGLARLVRQRYRTELVGHYEAIGYRRPFIDKFYRDYSLTGIPEGLLLALDDLARHWDGLFVCVLKGGLPFTAMLGLLGVPSTGIRHVMAGRRSGSMFEDSYMFEPVDFARADVAGRHVLLVENNLAIGATLTHLAPAMAALDPTSVGVFLDYILTDLAGIDAANLVERIGFPLDPIICGPFPARVSASVAPADADRVRDIRRRLLNGLAAATPPR